MPKRHAGVSLFAHSTSLFLYIYTSLYLGLLTLALTNLAFCCTLDPTIEPWMGEIRMKNTKIAIRFADDPPQKIHYDRVLSARRLRTVSDIDRFVLNHGDGHPEVMALRRELGPTGLKYVRSRGSAKI